MADKEDKELIATLARVELLKAHRAARIATPQRTTRLAVLGRPPPLQTISDPSTTLGSSVGTQNLVTTWQGKELLISVELSNRYPTIDKSHFKAIKKNKFKLINVVKLTTDFGIDRSKVKVIAVGSDVALEARKEDALSGELKRFLHLIQCFLIYMSIILYFTHDSLEKQLWIGMLAYIEQLWIFSSTYTFDSIKILPHGFPHPLDPKKY